MKLHSGVLNGKRVEYFKGSSAVKALQSPAYAKLKSAPKVPDEAEATKLLHQIIRFAFFLRIDRGESITLSSGGPAGSSQVKKTKAKLVQINQIQMFALEHHYVWLYEGSQWTTYLGGVIMVAIILAGVMFPLWPPIMRQGVSYLSMAVLGLVGLFFGIAILRLIFYIITMVVASPGIWIFPNLFADVGFVDSFIPAWDWDIKKKKKKKSEKTEKPSKRSKSGQSSGTNTPNPEGQATLAVPKHSSGGMTSESDTSRPASRGPTIEEVEDEDA